MNELENIKKIYFLGIGGIGMSALARYFHNRGAMVSGYDKTRTALTVQLEQIGIYIHYRENIDTIPKDVDLVVYTPAISAANKELKYYSEHNFKLAKRSDVLQWITQNSFNICVSGTHGKTTISTMIAHILRDAKYGCNAFLGGISVNYNTNFWSSEKNVYVVEADEYDRSFLKLNSDVAIITAMDADHLDIYGNKEEMENAFIQFSQKLKPGGCLITKYDLKRNNEFNASVHFTYSLNNSGADVYADDIKILNGAYQFNIKNKNWELKNITLFMGGLHNIENAVAAILVAKYLKIDDEKIRAALINFQGVKRRFEFIIKPGSKADKTAPVLIDDYAHHPEELRALITGARDLYPQKKCTVIFQPHLFTRTRDLSNEFAEVLGSADEVILLPIYAAREQPLKGVTSEAILTKIKVNNKKILSKKNMLEEIKKEKRELIIMCGAGDIYSLVQPVKEILLNT